MKPPETSKGLLSHPAIQRSLQLRHINLIAALAAFTFFCLPYSHANTDDESLEFLIKKSAVVIDAEIAEMDTGTVWETGVVEWAPKLRNITLLGGGPDIPGNRIQVVRFANTEKDMLPYFKTGERCIFFLKPMSGGIPQYMTSDMWFGIQPYTETMAKRIQALSKPDLSSPAAIRRAAGVKPNFDIPSSGTNR